MTGLLVHSAILLYALAAAVYAWWLLLPAPAKASVARGLLAVGVVLHAASFGVLVAAGGDAVSPEAAGLFSWRGGTLFSLLAGLMVASYLAIDWRYHLTVAGPFVSALTVAAMVPAHLVPAGGNSGVAAGPGAAALLTVHIATASLGTAAVALSFVLALLFLVSERQLKRKRPGKLFARLPSLFLLEGIGWLLAVWGFIFLSVCIVTGPLVARQTPDGLWRFAVKEGFAVLSWLLFAAMIQARLVAGWRGRRLALLVVAGFVLLVGSYVGLVRAAPPTAVGTAWAAPALGRG